MIGMYVSAAAALVLAGAAIGIIVMVCLGIKRDDRPGGFPADANDRITRAARKMTGAGVRSPELAAKASRRQDTLLAGHGACLTAGKRRRQQSDSAGRFSGRSRRAKGRPYRVLTGAEVKRTCRRPTANWQPKPPPTQRWRSASRTARSRRSGPADRSYLLAACGDVAGRWTSPGIRQEQVHSSTRELFFTMSSWTIPAAQVQHLTRQYAGTH
jgi:hypothetical protein